MRNSRWFVAALLVKALFTSMIGCAGETAPSSSGEMGAAGASLDDGSSRGSTR